jgi:uncharacterized membrane protein (UPF0136 family)
VNNEREIHVTSGELFMLVVQTFLLVGAVAGAVLGLAPALREHARGPVGMGVATFVIALLVLPIQRVLSRAYYQREVPVFRSVLSALAATVLVFGGWWIVQSM